MKTINKKPNICYLRGSYLNPFETQYLTLLQNEFDIVAAHPRYHRYSLSGIKLPRIELPCLDYLNGIIPLQIAGRKIPNLLKYLGYEEILFSLERYTTNFDIVQVPEQSFYFTWQVAKNKKKIGYKLITMQDEVNPFWYLHRPAIAKRTAFVRQETDLFIARSERAKTALVGEGVVPNRVRVIGHGVDTTRFKPGSRNSELCNSFCIDPHRLIILFVGRLFWTKGIFALADAAKLLLSHSQIKRLDPLFLIVGDGDERAAFETRIKQLGIDKSFRLVGWQPYDLLPDLHRLADIFVLPSISTRFVLEQFGIALIESMATGKPVISTYCGAIDEVVGDAGILVQPNDYFRLYRALLRLCQNKDLRVELGDRSLTRVKELFSVEAISEAITSAYREVLG